MICVSVVSIDSARIFFLLTALNDCDILSSDINNAFLNAYVTEKIYYRAGLERKEAIKIGVVVVVRSLYGLNFQLIAWRTQLCTILK